jgi:SAM-dependent methyltransferase
MTGRFRMLGADVVGVDKNEDLLAAARSAHPGLRFEKADLTSVAPEAFGPVDGIWSSFVAAYLPDLVSLLTRWSRCLLPGGWLALVEMDDLLGHAPLPAEYVRDVQAFYAEALRAGRYDFLAGRLLADAVRAAGLRILSESLLPDDELSFAGPATKDVLTAWRHRLARMPALARQLGPRFPGFEDAFLAALASPEHRTTCRVLLVVAERGAG